MFFNSNKIPHSSITPEHTSFLREGLELVEDRNDVSSVPGFPALSTAPYTE